MPKADMTSTKAKDYRIIPAHGAWGGVSLHQEVIVDLFVERREPPEKLTLEFEEGKPAKVTDRSGEKIVRESQIGVVFDPRVAYSVGEFLMGKAKEAGFTPKASTKKEKEENEK